MVLAEPLYAALIIDILRIPDRLPYASLHTTRPAENWRQAEAALDQWGWP